MTGRTYVHRDDVSDTFEHVGNKVGNTFGKFVLDVDSQKQPPNEILTSTTTDIKMPFVPSIPPMVLSNIN
jgi:archaeosine-15-forming tRNA-guanine transglycosylase